MDVGEQSVSIHTHRGVQLFAFGPDDQLSLLWTREWREVSRCDLVVPTMVGKHLPVLMPWLHWVSVWDNEARLVWTGPIAKITIDADTTTINARDIAALLARTRVPITKRWDGARPETIADELWQAMLENHGLLVDTIVAPDPEGDTTNFDVETDARQLDQAHDDLVNLGLSWTVVAGTPLLGCMPKRPITTLGMDDFVGAGLQLVRDGERVYNDVLVRGASDYDRYRVDLHGLNLQTLVTVDNVTTVASAGRQFARYTASMRNSLVMSGNTVLHPDAPIQVAQLVPSARFVVDAYDMLTEMELETVEMSCSTGVADVSVNLTEINTDVDLEEMFAEGTGQQAIAKMKRGTR